MVLDLRVSKRSLRLPLVLVGLEVLAQVQTKMSGNPRASYRGWGAGVHWKGGGTTAELADSGPRCALAAGRRYRRLVDVEPGLLW